MASCVSHILRYLFAESTLAKRRKALFQILVPNIAVGHRDIHLAESFIVSKYPVINNACQTVKLHEIVLQGRGRQEQLFSSGQDCLQLFPHDVIGLVDVPQTMGFIDDDQVPRNKLQVDCLF